MNIVKVVHISLLVVLMLLGVPSSLAIASVVDYEDEPERQEECEEESDYDFLCSGSGGVEGKPFCDLYNATESIKVYPNMTEQGCWERTINPIAWCERFDDLTNTYEYCREVPGTQEYFEYIETGGPDESCLFDVYQIKCQPFPNADDCPEDFGMNEDGYCFPLDENGVWTCPEGYHNVDDDETGQCYPNEEECEDYEIFEEGKGGEDSDSCRALYYVCDTQEYREHDKCIEFCNEDPERFGCNFGNNSVLYIL
jgi:hypothetical protein